MDNQQAPASVVFLLPALIIMVATVAVIGGIVKLWNLALKNREFRDTVLQLQATVQNSIEAMVESVSSIFR